MNKNGQSMIEYMFIAILVILGVVIMGPYVLRSVNAHFKIWDESVQDSSTENITQAPVGDVPPIISTCPPCTDIAGSCGGSATGLQCGANQRNYSHNCTPMLCDGAPASYCQSDPTCCTAWTNIGCGTIPVGQSPTSDNCNYGFEIQGQQCGNNNTVQCIANPSCNPQCLGVISPGSLFCATNTASPPTTGLNQSYGITYVGNQASCPSPATCQVYCDSANSYFLNSTGSACLRTFTVAPKLDTSGQGNWPFNYRKAQQHGPDINDQSFSMCAAPGVVITKALVTADPPGQSTTTPTPVPGDGCQNPGEPSDVCQVTLVY
jgi:hypothetical protein